MPEKAWRSFRDECLHCGADAEVLTTTGQDNCAYDGDRARCVGCGCPGVVDAFGEDEQAAIDWHDEFGCDCDWCKTHPADRPSDTPKAAEAEEAEE